MRMRPLSPPAMRCARPPARTRPRVAGMFTRASLYRVLCRQFRFSATLVAGGAMLHRLSSSPQPEVGFDEGWTFADVDSGVVGDVRACCAVPLPTQYRCERCRRSTAATKPVSASITTATRPIGLITVHIPYPFGGMTMPNAKTGAVRMKFQPIRVRLRRYPGIPGGVNVRAR